MATNTGSGQAENAGVDTDDEPIDFDEKAQAKLLKQEAAARVAGAKSRVAKLEEHLEGAKKALAQAIADEKDL
jgi:hypothetical protein